jgi:membrane protein YqaA with SNARE-associated domain
VLAALAQLSFIELGLIAAMAAVASIIGGVAGYGTGALMPLVLVPIVGAEPVVPISRHCSPIPAAPSRSAT